jgi:F-type H+-transporting ATPase subunit epsilon
MAFRLQIVTPQRPLVDAEVDTVRLPGELGEFGVLEGHEPLLAALAPGIVEYELGGGSERVVVSGGFAEVTQERVTVLARTAERPEEIDRARAEAAQARATERLRRGELTEPGELATLEAAAARASARLRLIGG